MNRIVLFGFAALLMMGSMAGAQPAETVELAAIFAAETPGCAADVVGVPAPLFVQAYWTCGSCSVSACQGLGPGSYCGKNASGTYKYCQAGVACSGQTELDRRCFCL